MSSGSESEALPSSDRERLQALRSAESLRELAELTDADTLHGAYFAAKREWAALRDRELPPPRETTERLPGDRVQVGGHDFRVHGVTHADSDAERAFVREHVRRFLDAGESVYCEQGIRPLYFRDLEDVCAMDDYRWAIIECEKLDVETHLPESTFTGVVEDVGSVATQFREVAFSLIHSGRDVYGEEFERALGDVASDFLMSHEDVATGKDFESFARSKEAAENPARLEALQRYYKIQFLPQPLEREWLRRHDPELEILSHARNERMADYAVAHNEDAETVHLVVGAAHQPGVVYYLEEHRDGDRGLEGFELVE